MGWIRPTAVAALLGATALLTSACNRYGYTAHIERVEGSGAWTTVRGWVVDPAAGIRGGCPTLVVSVGGHTFKNATCSLAAPGSDAFGIGWGARPDVEAARGRVAGQIAFQFLAGLAKGVHSLCLDVVPRDDSTLPDLAQECVDITVPADQFSSIVLDTAQVNGGILTAGGWRNRVVRTSTEGLNQAYWFLDGTKLTPGGSTVVTDVARPDVVAAHGAGIGTTLSMPAPAPGSHQVCLAWVWGNDSQPAGTPDCKTVQVP
ncbi:MAG: hypothetical protein R2698_13960 [Microthrixaceae bacterium]